MKEKDEPQEHISDTRAKETTHSRTAEVMSHKT